jgi:hypothetical protein
MSAPVPDFAPFWEEVESIFDPEQPVREPQLFAERDRKYAPIVAIERHLRANTRVRTKFILTGTPGNGKTSELLHCAARLARTRMVVHTDIWEHLVATVGNPGAINLLEPWEMLGLIGLAIFRAGNDCFGHKWEPREIKALESALKKLRGGENEGSPELDLVTLARGIAVAAGGVVGGKLGPIGASLGAQAVTALVKAAADATEWKWRLGRGGAAPHSDQDSEVQALLNAVNRLVMSLHAAYGRPLLLILDGIDRVTDPDRLRALFVDSNLLSRLECDAIVTVALLPMRSEGQVIVGFECNDFSNIPVLDQNDPTRPGPGIAYFHDLLGRRIDQVRANLDDKGLKSPSDPFPAAIVDRLAYLSGGIPRDFVRLIRLTAVEAIDAKAETINEDLIAPAIRDERKRREHLMNSEEIAVLHQVMDDPAKRLPGDPIALDLLRQKRLVPYPNDSTWYYPHPLLTLGILRRG